MVEIQKTPRVQEGNIHLPGGDAGVAAERARLIEELRHGNIHEVLAKSSPIVRADIERFFSDQWRDFKGQVVQDTEIKAAEGSYYEPNINNFMVHHKGAALSSEERHLYAQEMAVFMGKAQQPAPVGEGGEGPGSGGAGGGGATPFSGKFKAQGVGKAEEAGTDLTADETEAAGSTGDEAVGPMTAEEMQQTAQGTVDEWTQMKEGSFNMILNAQFMHDYQARMGEIKAEVQKILAMVKSGQIEPEFALIALAKVNSTKNGCLMTWLGKEAYHVNDSMNKVYEELKTMGSTDPRYFGSLQDAQAKTRDGSFQLQLLQTDMQKVMQDVASVMEFAHSSISEIARNRREISQNVGVKG